MTPAVEIYERVLADSDQRDVEARLATLSAIAKDVEKRNALAAITRRPITRRMDRHAARPLPTPLLVSHAADDSLDAPTPLLGGARHAAACVVAHDARPISGPRVTARPAISTNWRPR